MVQSFDVQAAVNHFCKEEWCAKLLQAPGVAPLLPVSRMQDGGGKAAQGGQSRDQLFAKILNNGDSVPWMLAFFQDPSATPPPPPPPPGNPASPTLLIPSITLLFDLQPGVDGFSGYTHGGFIASMADEAMGSLFVVNYSYQLQRDAMARRAAKEDPTGKTSPTWPVPPGVRDMLTNPRMFTARMSIKLQKPIKTPAIVAATASIAKIDGRKLSVDVAVRDSTGSICASCDGLWMAVPAGAKI